MHGPESWFSPAGRGERARRLLRAAAGLSILVGCAILVLMVLEVAWTTVIWIVFILPLPPSRGFEPAHCYVYLSLGFIGMGCAMRYVAPAVGPGKRPIDERAELRRRLRIVFTWAVGLTIGVLAVLGARSELFEMWARQYEERLDRESPSRVPEGASKEWVAKALRQMIRNSGLRDKYRDASVHPWRPLPPDPPEPE